MPTYWHERVGPQFEGDQAVFSVNHSQSLSKEPSRVSYDTMNRLMTKPQHKTSRVKFDHTNKISLAQKCNTAQTAEDKVPGDDIQFINSLRPLDPSLTKVAQS